MATPWFGGGLTLIIFFFRSKAFARKITFQEKKHQIMLATPVQEDKDMEVHRDLATK